MEFSWASNKPNTVSILGEEVEVVDDYRSSGVYLRQKMQH